MMLGVLAAAIRRAIAPEPAEVAPVVRNAQAVATAGSQASQVVSIVAEAGDLIIVNFNLRAVATPVPGLSSGGWTLYGGAANGSSVASFLWFKIAEGNESLTITPSSPNHMATSVLVVAAGTHQGVIESAMSTGSGSPNPMTLSPSWGKAKTLWLASYGQANGTTVSAYPLPDNNNAARSLARSSGCSTAMCTQHLEAESLDPAVFTPSATGAYLCRHIAIQPGPPPLPGIQFLGATTRSK